MKNNFSIKTIVLLTMLVVLNTIKGQSLSKTQDPLEGNLYSITNTGSYAVYLSKFNYQTGVATAISPSVVVRKMNPGLSAIDPIHHRFIILSSFIDGGDTLYNIDLATGLVVNKNKLSLAATHYNEVIEFNCRNATLYSMIQQRTGNGVSLCSIDPLSGVETVISPWPIAGFAGSGQSALDPVNGRFFFYGLYDTLYSVNLTNGKIINRVKLSSSGQYYHPSFEYNSEDGILYTIMGAGNNSFFGKADPVTGKVTMISAGKMAGYAGTFQSALDPVNNLYFCFAQDSLCAINITTGALAFKNKAVYSSSPSPLGSSFLGYETPCTQKYAGIKTYDTQLNATKLFPNPVSTCATIKLTTACRDAMVAIYDFSGKKINQLDNFNGDELKFERNNLPAGVYFVKIIEEGRVIGFEKLIVVD